MKTIIFGGIGTIANTSYLQRKAFNTAFQQLSIQWRWDEQEYRSLLVQTGGESRIFQYNEEHGGLPAEVTPAEVHSLKTRLFHRFMQQAILPLRPGVQWVIEQAKLNNMKLAFATTTSHKNIDVLLKAAQLDHSTFDVISNSSLVEVGKPDPEVYNYCMQKLNVLAVNSLAIEDSNSGLEAAVSADIQCIAFPNEYTADHSYDEAAEKVLDLEQSTHLSTFFASN